MPRDTSPVTKSHIFDLKNEGFSSAEVARRVGVHPTTVTRVYNNLLKNPDFYYVKPKSGRPQKLSQKDREFAVLQLARGHAHSAIDLQRKFFPHVHPDTVRNALREQGFSAHRKRKVPFLSHHHILSRLKWARAHRSWSVENWERVIFSDESKFNLFGSDGLQYCWRKGGQALDSRYTKKQVKHGGGKVMVWGCISPHGVGRLCRIDGTMDSNQYISILQEGYLGTLKDLHTNPQGFIFQSDNDSKHKSRATQAWLREIGIPTLDWPSSSPDMNIMENLWAYLDNCIRAHPMNPSNSEELWKILQQEWYKISPKYIRKLYESLPERVEEVCKVKGGNTKY